MSWNDAGYGAAGGWRQSSAATITPLLASGSWVTLSASRSERHHAPPGSSTMIGKGPVPCGRERRTGDGGAAGRVDPASPALVSWVNPTSPVFGVVWLARVVGAATFP